MKNPVLKALFSSDTRIKVLAFFLVHPDERFYPRQLEKLLELPVGQFDGELHKLEKIQLLRSSLDGRQKKYSINREFLLYDELKRIFLKTVSAGDTLKKHLSGLAGIEIVFIYGSFAKGEEHSGSDMDVMVIGDVSDRDIHAVVSLAEKELTQTINYSVYGRKEIIDRLKKKDNFITTVFNEPKVILLGKTDDELLRAG